MRDGLGAWRVGAGLGLLLAMKYTTLLLMPALLLMIDAPFRAGWRRRDYAAAAGVAILLAGPWYLRNFLMTGNPVFPVKALGLPGLFEARVSEQLRSAGGIWQTLTGRDQSLQAYLLVGVLIGLTWFVFLEWGRAAREPFGGW